MQNLTIGTEMIATERQKQIDLLGFTAEHAVAHPEWYEDCQLVYAAKTLLAIENYGEYPLPPKNWDKERFARLCERCKSDRVRIAGAFLAAELDRLVEIKNQLKSELNIKKQS